MTYLNVIDKYTDHWDRINSNTLVLWFSGYKPMAGYKADEELTSLGLTTLNYSFDKHSGKSMLVVRDVAQKRGGAK